MKLTNEQATLLSLVKNGKNVLVDACIGSGKTTTIQAICDELSEKRILYLTYNASLKYDAKHKIKNRNVEVTNYHGFAHKYAKVEPQKQIPEFLKLKPTIDQYDILLIDEYQDIDEEISQLLLYIKQCIKNLQIVAVGDIDQKLYDRDNLDVIAFMNILLDNYEKLRFTECFRLSAEYANSLGHVWNKSIDGSNTKCTTTTMSVDEVVEFLLSYKPKDILCLGKKNGQITEILNKLELRKPLVFNKNTVYATINDRDKSRIDYDNNVAVFTTFDSSKGLERKINIVCDFTESYWETRAKHANTKYEILRNIFLVAASRGKMYNIFVEPNNHSDQLLGFDRILPFETNTNYEEEVYNPASMFDFKYNEDIKKLYSMLTIRKVNSTTDNNSIDLKTCDGLIDIAPCIGIWQEADFFTNYDIDNQVYYSLMLIYFNNTTYLEKIYKTYLINTKTIEEKILYAVSLQTNQRRYRTQVDVPFISNANKVYIEQNLSKYFSGSETVQQDFKGEIICEYNEKTITLHISGRCDVIKDDHIYELKFKSDLAYVDFLQLSLYLLCAKQSTGYLYNSKLDELYEVKLPRARKKFIDCIAKCITKQKSIKTISFNTNLDIIERNSNNVKSSNRRPKKNHST